VPDDAYRRCHRHDRAGVGGLRLRQREGRAQTSTAQRQWIELHLERSCHERVTAYPGLTGRPLRELRERGYGRGYTAVTDILRGLRPAQLPAFEVRFKTPPGEQAQVDFAQI